MDKTIKIFVDAHSFDKEYQGTQTFVRELYVELLKYPMLNIYFGVYSKARLLKAFPSLDASKIITYTKPRFPLQRLIVDIPGIIKKHNFHFAHFQNIAPWQKKDCKYIVTLHDVLCKDFKNQFPYLFRKTRNILFGKSIKVADIKTTVSDYSACRINHHYKISPEQLTVLRNGVKKNPNCRTREEARKFIWKKYGIENFILNVSRIEPRKNHELLLDEYLQLELAKKGINLVFIGKNSIDVPSLYKKIKASKTIFWIEQVEPGDLEVFYKACLLFVYPSKAEGFGIPPLEAALHKAPVLCSNTTAMSDFAFFQPFYFDPGKRNELADKMQEMLVTPPSFEKLDQIAMHIQKNYCWKRTAEKFYGILQNNMYQ